MTESTTAYRHQTGRLQSIQLRPARPTVSSSTHPDPAQWYSAYAFAGSWTAATDGTSGVAGYQVKVDQNPTGVPSGALQTGLTFSKTVGYSGVWYIHVRAEDNAGNFGTTANYEFNVGTGGVLSPAKGDRTQRYFTLQSSAQSGVTGVTFQYRRGQNDTWTTIPAADVVDSDNGNASITWPVSLFGTAHATHHLSWDAKSTLASADGPALVRATFTGVSGSADPVQVSLDQHYFDQTASQGNAFAAVGPGQLNLWTGDYTVGSNDAVVGPFSVDRAFHSTAPTASSTGIFGPGWSSTLNLATYASLHSGADSSQGTFVTIYGGDGTEYGFYSNSSGAIYNDAQNDQDMTLVQCTGSGTPSANCQTASTFLLTEPSGTETIFAKPSGGSEYMPTAIIQPNNSNVSGATTSISYTVVSGVTRPTQEVAPAPSGVDCSTAPLTTKGCQTLTFAYATSNTSTSACSTSFGDFSGQLRSISYTAWNPSSSAMATTTVMGYSYDSTGELRAACDPRISPVLATTYTYDASNRLASVGPPGLNAYSLNYDGTNRLTSITRANDPTGTQTTSVVYAVPLSGSGAPYDLSGATVATWGQTDMPTGTATAVFPASEVPTGSPPSDYNYATLYYMDGNGNLVNVAQPGGYITTTEYDSNGNVVRSLSAKNRADALAAPSRLSYALTHDSEATYDASGDQLLRQLGPDHQVTLSDGTITMARSDVKYTYDESAPSGGPFNLVTTQTEGALQDGATSDTNVRTTTYDYSGQSNLGWTLGQPTSVTVDPGTGKLSLKTTTKYDSLGRTIAAIQPGNTAGGDAHETDTTYYRAGTGSGVAACDNHPEWDGLVCQVAPAAQPGTSGLPNIPVTTTTYDLWGNLATVTSTSGASSKVVTDQYDSADRLAHVSITGPGTTLPTVDYGYSSTTGLRTTVSTTTGGTTTTVTSVFDQDGRLKTYTDADGNQSTYAYDRSNRPSSINDGHGTETLSYDQNGERRGLLTTVADSTAGSFTAMYDADGSLLDEHLPNGLDECLTYDSIGDVIDQLYQSGGVCGATGTTTKLEYGANVDIHGATVGTNGIGTGGLATAEGYTYDAAGRVTQAQDTLAGQCTTRQYGYDADSNRTQFVSTAPGSGGACQTGTLATVHAYDAADRLTDSGIAYDAMGRTTTLPAADTGSTQQTFTYYSNDRLNTMVQAGMTRTATLDPNWRVRTLATSTDSTATQTDHYSDESDTPTWIADNTSGTNWTRNVDAFTGLDALVNQAGTTTFELHNLHDDVAAEADGSGNITSTTDYQEFGAPRTGSGLARLGWLGSYGRQVDSNSGIVLMGARGYSPALGRFLQTDPAQGGSANAYDYAFQQPIDNSDILGTYSCYRYSYGWTWHKDVPLVSWNITDGHSGFNVALACWHRDGTAIRKSFQWGSYYGTGSYGYSVDVKHPTLSWSWDNRSFYAHQHVWVHGPAIHLKIEKWGIGIDVTIGASSWSGSVCGWGDDGYEGYC